MPNGKETTIKPAHGRKPEPIDRRVGAKIREMRIAKRMSQAALGDEIGLTFQQIQKYESGANRIALSTLLRLCDALGAQPAQVVNEIAVSGPPEDLRRPSVRTVRDEQAIARIQSEPVRKAMAALANAIADAKR
jgi:transcriptional regulator with XRE-family HTH domain